ncbi:hypothetical protein [Acetobacter fallax]|uniref:Fibronectin type-III domain-containing protein n=1 Tax=Acetobacter fallax TaxID=1737473 RepID=A0ABX0KD01_9PROT|nr:hypothetical protein [Acetobacter fallax]NHO33344.1 hypothetical protein [Acetobacter fallax]NHO36965.1 hypothetical protein [Acetobacter fallax]
MSDTAAMPTFQDVASFEEVTEIQAGDAILLVRAGNWKRVSSSLLAGGQPVTEVIGPGATYNLAFGAAGNNGFSIVPNAPLTLSASGGTQGQVQFMAVHLTQPATGGFAVTWGSGIIWRSGSAPVFSTAAGAELLVLLSTDDGGVTIIGDAPLTEADDLSVSVGGTRMSIAAALAQIQAGTGNAAELTRGLIVQPKLTVTDLALAAPVSDQEIAAFAPVVNNGGMNQITVDPRTVVQEWMGCGCAVTDSVAYNLLTYFPVKADRLKLYDMIWGSGGMNTIRTEIGPCDYRFTDWPPYIADDVTDDWTCSTFSMPHDEQYKLMILREICEVNPDIKIIGSAWTPPLMFKEAYSGPGSGGTGPSWNAGQINPTTQVFNAYALYLIKFVQAYAAHGVPVWALTMGNENNFGSGTWPSTYWSADNLTAFAPILKSALMEAGLDTLVMGGDVSWQYGDDLNSKNRFTESMAANGAFVRDYAFHNYAGSVSSQTFLISGYGDIATPLRAHMTEYCADYRFTATYRAQMMIPEMFIGNIRAQGCSLTLWNMILDDIGGPWQASLTEGNSFHGVLDFNRSTLAVTKTAEYYYLAHIAQMFPPGTKIIRSTNPGFGINYAGIQNAAGLRPDGTIVVALFNNQAGSDTCVVRDGVTGTARQVTLQPYAFSTLEWSVADAVSDAGTLAVPPALTNVAGVSSGGKAVFSWGLPSTATCDIAGIRVVAGTSPTDTSLSTTLSGTATSWTPAATAGQTIYATFAPLSVGGSGPTSAQVSVAVVAPPAGAPTVSATATINGADVTVAPATSGTAAASFDIYAGSSATTLAKIGNVAANGTSPVTYAATGLTAGSLYYVAATPIEADGTAGTQSETTTVTPIATAVPGAPTIALTPGDAKVTIVITPPADNGGAALASYSIYGGTSAGSLSKIGTVAANGTAPVTYVQSPEPNGTTVYMTASATNAVGEGEQSAVASVTPGAAATAPGAPAVTLTPGNGQIVVAVAAPANNGGATITGYPIIVNDASSPVTTLTAAGSYAVTGLTNGTAVSVKVGATNSVGTTYSADQSATPVAPVAPTEPAHYLQLGTNDGGAWVQKSIDLTNGVLDSEILLDLNGYTSATVPAFTKNTFLFGDYDPNNTNNTAANCSFGLLLGTDGTPGINVYDKSGTTHELWAETGTAGTPVGFSTGKEGGIRCILNASGAAFTAYDGKVVANDTAQFFQSLDGSTWEALGSAQAYSGTGLQTAASGGSYPVIAAGMIGGKVFSAFARNGNGAPAYGPDFTTASTGASTVTDAAGVVWNVDSGNGASVV